MRKHNILLVSAALIVGLVAVITQHGVPALTTGAMAQEQTRQFAKECVLKDIAVITLIEDHGGANDLPADRLAAAGLAMLQARSTCYAGRVEEALTLYDSILALGPVASLQGQRP